VAESVLPDPGACRPPFPARVRSVALPTWHCHPPLRPPRTRASPTRPWPHITDLRHDHVCCALIPVTKIHDMPGPGVARARRGETRRAPRANPPPGVTAA
jgi:hypothetical protein